MPWGTINGELWLRAQSVLGNNRKPVKNFERKQNLESQRVIVSNFTKAGVVLAVLIATIALNVTAITGPIHKIFVAQVDHLSPSPQAARSSSSTNTAFRGSHQPNIKTSNSSKS